MDRHQLLLDFQETFKVWIEVHNTPCTVEDYRVIWYNPELQGAWVAWVCSYETYAMAHRGALTGTYTVK